jgi:DNA-binding transcriptional LysR family regulator
MFRRVFERVVESCLEAGLVGGEGFAVDASLIEADVIEAEFEMPPMPVNIVHVPSRHKSPAARALIEMLRRGMRAAGTRAE